MIKIESIEYPGIEYIKNNMPFFKDKFIKDSLIVFRNANLTFEEHEELQIVMGDGIGWFPNSNGGYFSRYIEDHEKNELRTETNKDEVVLSWHVEHPCFDNPIVAGLWNMIVFNIPEGHGNTLFLDTAKVYALLSDEDKKFLDKCVVNSYSYGYAEQMLQTKAIKPHWLTGEPLIGFSLDRIHEGWHDLYSFDERTPTYEENQKFLKIANWIATQIWDNENFRIVHKWQKGDLIIPDLHKLAHAVMGGFSPKDRKFTGLWSYQFDNNLMTEIHPDRLK